MIDKLLDSARESAIRAAQRSQDYKSETYLAVLLAGLLGISDSTVQTQPLGPERAGQKLLKAAERPYSPGELFANTAWSTEIDKVVVAAFFLEQHKGLRGFTIQEVRGCLISAKVSPPQNANLAILRAVQKGWLMEAPVESAKKKTWALTRTGEQRIAEMSRPSSK
jgi:hypothetical protein